MNGSELSCRELVELVTDYFDGALPSPEVERFEAHLGHCSGCRAYLAQMRQTIRATGSLTEETITPTTRDALLQVFRGWKRG
jgi:anti-sigma factor RsiW